MAIGVINIKITDTISFLLLPLIYSLVMGLALYLAKPIKFVGKKQSRVAEGAMVLFIGVLICKLAIASGQAISSIFQVGPALILQQIGNLGTLLALPIALFFGFRREVPLFDFLSYRPLFTFYTKIDNTNKSFIKKHN